MTLLPKRRQVNGMETSPDITDCDRTSTQTKHGHGNITLPKCSHGISVTTKHYCKNETDKRHFNENASHTKRSNGSFVFTRRYYLTWILWLLLLVLDLSCVTSQLHHECSACTCIEIAPNEFKMDCQKRNLTSVPRNVSLNIVELDLGVNSLSDLRDKDFSSFRNLRRLYLANNSLTSLPGNVFSGLHTLLTLSLEANLLTSVPRKAIRNLHSLEQLNLEYNRINSVPNNSFRQLKKLTSIRLDGNRLATIPVTALKHAKSLNVLNLDNNLITDIPDHAFSNLHNLAFLTLNDNKIKYIDKHAFDGLQVLYWLTLDNNRLTQIPEALNSLPDLFDLSIKNNLIEYVDEDSFGGNKKLSNFDLDDNPIAAFHKNAFRNIPALEKLTLSEARDLTEFPNLYGTTRLDKIHLDRAAIQSLPDDLCEHLPRLTEFDIHTNKIAVIPNMTGCSNLTLINLGNNNIVSLETRPFAGLEKLKDLTLSFNKIASIPEQAFEDLPNLEYLDLSHNEITFIHVEAFNSLSKLRDLNLGENQFSSLPTKGLRNLRNLKTFHNKYLLQPPNQDDIPNIQTMVLAYAYHCCAFIRRPESESKEAYLFTQTITWLQNTSDVYSIGHLPPNASLDDYPNPFGDDYPYYDYGIKNDSLNDSWMHLSDLDILERAKPPVDCTPVPGPFLPCDDLFGWWSLRCGVWIVFLLAVLGNGAVLLVSITSKSKMDVTRFLICNLALSDLFMGIYLGFLAIVDASSLGEFEMYAVRWQSSAGCLVAGFLGVLSSELSVYTLVVITIERFYAISNAMQLDKRLRLKQAGILMAIGWVVCLSIACLPLFEVSDYRKFAICLPFETENKVSLGYVCFIMIFNAISFLIILVCYTAMFVSIRGSHSWNSNDTIVAKRMALLVFTDFFCWAPIIFCSLTAALEWNFAQISLNEAKILTIFVLPLNSCANPFLYAFFTRQFKRDCVKLCQRIEEASISRHLPGSAGGRASYMSNRYHVQGNTYRFKNASCGHSNQEASTSGEASYSNSDTDINFKNVADQDQHILKYVRSDSGIFVDGTKSAPFSDDIQVLDLIGDNEVSDQDSPRKQVKVRREIREDFDSGPDIVLHTKDGHILFKAKKRGSKLDKKKVDKTDKTADSSATCAKRLCYHAKKLDANVKQVDEKQCAFVEPKTIEEGEILDLDTSTKHGRQVLLRQKFEAERSNDLGLKVTPLKTDKNPAEMTKNKDSNIEKGAPEPTNVKLRRPRRPELPSEVREKDKQINEWRKSAHLSYQCKGSGNFNSVAQKQKSNSLVELTRFAYDWKTMTNKRHSLSSRHEGYLLLKNRTRDSAYDDEVDDLYEFDNKPIYAPRKVNSSGNLYTVIQGRKCESRKYRDFPIEGDEVCETAILLPLSEKSSKESHKVNSCESGISSSS